jgi:hypothetical protein
LTNALPGSTKRSNDVLYIRNVLPVTTGTGPDVGAPLLVSLHSTLKKNGIAGPVGPTEPVGPVGPRLQQHVSFDDEDEEEVGQYDLVDDDDDGQYLEVYFRFIIYHMHDKYIWQKMKFINLIH